MVLGSMEAQSIRPRALDVLVSSIVVPTRSCKLCARERSPSHVHFSSYRPRPPLVSRFYKFPEKTGPSRPPWCVILRIRGRQHQTLHTRCQRLTSRVFSLPLSPFIPPSHLPTDCPQESQDYYGTGESFVYSFHPTFKAHRWTGANDYFCISSESWLAMGGGGGGFAFQIDDELDAGESNPSDTFGSPRLSSNEFFRCVRLRLRAFFCSPLRGAKLCFLGGAVICRRDGMWRGWALLV